MFDQKFYIENDCGVCDCYAKDQDLIPGPEITKILIIVSSSV